MPDVGITTQRYHGGVSRPVFPVGGRGVTLFITPVDMVNLPVLVTMCDLVMEYLLVM